ncbi:Methyl-CpG-binding domain-containing protein 9 [Cymbomonas tetramitiformis]|uniref:Methyl-CpG-binding domain-containing protein 9 n=1 Tax=Cymbomonas tetramitiformis TaxID=36881 RepID=A0AAE0BRI6_9CHLO|nr:Methyl-CpG-binding domain-containing protein 9 [Cymbomonas tetramitiformis]
MVWDSTGTRSSTTHAQALADGIMLVLCAIWRVMGGHHAIQGTVSALVLRVMVALAGYWWQPYSTTFSLLFALYSEVRYLRTAAIYCKLLWVGEATNGQTSGNTAEPGVTTTREEASFFSRTVSTLHNVVARGRAELNTNPRRMRRPRFAQRLQQEVLPYTVIEDLQPGGKTSVTKDEAAWLDTELNATFGGHPDFTDENWDQMRDVIRRIMDYELRMLQHCTVCYVDDVVVYSDTAEQHIKDVEEVLRTLGDAGIRLHSGKSTFGAATVDFLGYRIGHNTIGAQEAKSKAIMELPKPEDKTGLRSILGLMNYYKGLVGEVGGPNYSELARPLNDLLRKEVTDIKAAWGIEQDESLQKLKDALCSGRCLRPIDYDKPIILYTDWSKYGIGAVLGQKDEDGARLERSHGEPMEASYLEHNERGFCDSWCKLLTEDPPIGDEIDPELQIANYCLLQIREQLGTGPMHRLFDVHHREELECNVGTLFDTDLLDSYGDTGRLQYAAWRALSQVQPATGMQGEGSPAVYHDEEMEYGNLKKPKRIGTRVVAKSLFREAREEGVTCYEPCGGLCAGLEMLLRNGVRVNKYLYQDISPAARAVARARCFALSRRYPELFPASAIKLEQLPADLEQITVQHFIDAGALAGERSVESKELPKCREPNLDEKAHATGYSVTELRSADKLDDGKLARVLGLAMDRRAVELLYAVAEASRLGLPYSKEQHQAEETCDSPAWEPEEGDWEMHKRAHKGTHGLGAKFQQRKKRWEMQPFSAAQYRGRSATGFTRAAPSTQTESLVTGVPSWRPPAQEKPMRLPALKDTTRLVELVASVAQQQEQREDFKDIHDDEWCRRWLKSRGTAEPPVEMANRVKRRSARHRWDEATDEIYLITYAGKKLRVPKPADRLELRNWWVNMKKDVVAVVTQCKTCSRVKTHYARKAAVLTPLEIKSFITIKFCLKKIALDQGLDVAWDELLWSLVLSYNAAVQESVKVAPFTLLFAQEATVPPAQKSRLPLDFDVNEVKNESDSRVRDLVARAKVVKELMLTAGCNLEIAQHRDTLLYEGRRGGGQVPKPHNFQVGDFVYIRQRPRTGIKVATKPAILKLVKIQRDGVVVLEDSTRTREKSTVQNIAPCHLQVKDEYDLTKSKPSKHLACEHCKRMDGEAFMLLCDTCNKGYHTWCLEPALDSVPERDWQCPSCLPQEVSASFVEVKSELSEKLLQAEGKLKEALGKGMKLLEFDVGPKRALCGGAVKPWQALSREEVGKSEGSMGDWPDRIDWGQGKDAEGSRRGASDAAGRG